MALPAQNSICRQFAERHHLARTLPRSICATRTTRIHRQRDSAGTAACGSAGNSTYPNISIGLRPSNSVRSRATGCAKRDRFRHTQNLFVFPTPQVSQHFSVGGSEIRSIPCQIPERSFAGRSCSASSSGETKGRLLRFHIDGGVTINRIHNHRVERLGRRGSRKSRIPIGTPLHGSANAIAVAQVNVISHPDFVAVVNTGVPGNENRRHVHQFDRRRSFPEWRQPAANAQIDAQRV